MRKLFIFLVFTLLLSGCQYNENTNVTINTLDDTAADTISIDNSDVEISNANIEVAILLDTSNSMDGLIDQAKSQLWKMVNEISKARDDDGKMPLLKLALYEYGNSSLSANDGYIRQLISFTNDLDLISEKLFALTTNGGSEYCGEVIYKSVHDLGWSAEEENLRMVIIAGNEPFTQGSVDYNEAIADATQKDIRINTIFCGDYQTGIDTDWQKGANIGNGKYFNIDQDEKVVHIPAPQDDELSELNSRLNSTYIPYGSLGTERYEKQSEQDSTASSYGIENLAKRVITKSSKNYSNETWDLVDAIDKNKVNLEDVESELLPEEMRELSIEEQEQYIESKKAARQDLQAKIQELSKEREVFVAEKIKELGMEDNTLDHVISEMIQEQLESKNFSLQQ